MDATEPCAFAHAHFVHYVFAIAAAHVALSMQLVALGWHIYALTHNALDLGLIGLFEFLPAPILVLVSGHLADRINRERILGVGYCAQSLCSLALAFATQSGDTRVWHLFMIILLVGIARSFHSPAARALVPNLVPPEALANAVAWRASVMQISLVSGPVLGGWLYGIDSSLVFGASAVLQLLAAGSVSRIVTLQQRAVAERVTWQSLTAGIAFIRQSRPLLGAISLDLFAVLFGGVTALFPLYASDILHVGPAGLGWLRSAFAAGATVTALCLVRRAPQAALGKWLFLVVTMYGTATIAFGLSTHFFWSLAFLFVAGAADMISMYIRSALVPLLTPDSMRGRVTAVEMVFIGASNELGAFESGVVAALVGAVPAVVLGGLATLIISGWWIRLFPALYRIDKLSDLTPPSVSD